MKALNFLFDLTNGTLTGYHNKSWPVEVKLKKEYGEAMGAIKRKYEALKAEGQIRSDANINSFLLQPLDLEVTKEVVGMMKEPTRSLYEGQQADLQREQTLKTEQANRERRGSELKEQIDRETQTQRGMLALKNIGIGIGLCVLGIVLIIFGGKWNYRLKKYVFDNTTDGGAVEFEDYEASLRHGRNQYLAILVVRGGFILVAIGVIAIVFR